jgi:uncharacterized protein YndB with AHSA1/START domain
MQTVTASMSAAVGGAQGVSPPSDPDEHPLAVRAGPRPVVFSWGIPGNDELPPGGSTVEVVLTPDGDDTIVVLTHRGLPSSRIGDHRAGWEQQLGRLPAAAG